MKPKDKRVAEKLTAFENEREPALLQEALEIIEEARQETPARDDMAHTRQLYCWLQFFTTIDRHIDPQWDPKGVPTTGVIPHSSGGVAHFSNVNPSAIDDPAARAQYVQELKTNRDYAEWYRVQHELRRMNEHAIRAVGNILTERYTGSLASHQKFIEMLTSTPISELRKEQLRTLIPKQE